MGVVDVDAMLASMTVHQFNLWRHYEALEPFEEQRQDWRSAFIASILVNTHRKKGSAAQPLKNFRLKFDSEFEMDKPKKTWQQIKAINRILMEQHNKREEKKEAKRKRLDARPIPGEVKRKTKFVARKKTR